MIKIFQINTLDYVQHDDCIFKYLTRPQFRLLAIFRRSTRYICVIFSSRRWTRTSVRGINKYLKKILNHIMLGCAKARVRGHSLISTHQTQLELDRAYPWAGLSRRARKLVRTGGWLKPTTCGVRHSRVCVIAVNLTFAGIESCGVHRVHETIWIQNCGD